MCNTKISGYPSIDKPWLKYYSSEALHAQPASCTVYQNIYQHNKEHLSETALEYFGVKITFSKLFEHVEACAKALLSNGVRAGDCVTLCTAGTPEAVYIVLACSKSARWPISSIPCFSPPRFVTASMKQTQHFCLCWTSSTPAFHPSCPKLASGILLFFLPRLRSLLRSAFLPNSKALWSLS